MVRSDGSTTNEISKMPGVFDFIVRYGYYDLKWIIGVIMLGEGEKKKSLDHCTHYISENIKDTLPA